MTFTDHLLDIALMGIVTFQIRGRRLPPRTLLPLGIVSYVAAHRLELAHAARE